MSKESNAVTPHPLNLAVGLGRVRLESRHDLLCPGGVRERKQFIFWEGIGFVTAIGVGECLLDGVGSGGPIRVPAWDIDLDLFHGMRRPQVGRGRVGSIKGYQEAQTDGEDKATAPCEHLAP